MNREEAIKRLKEYAQYSYGIWHDDEEDTKAFDMAIEALSAEADCSMCKHKDKGWDSEECDSCCGNNNHYAPADTESKVDPIVIRPTTYLCKSDFDKWAAEVKKESNRIIVIPHNAEVVVNTVKGLWVEEQDNWYGGGAWVCSICGYGYSFGAYHEANEFRYCPNCGARMEANE